ncbi:MAG TPA: hypothetical protein VH477_12095 [Bryobacteraceae bacterium]
MRSSAAGLLVALLELSQAVAAPAPITPRVALAENQGFCPGTPPEWGWPAPKPAGIRLWTTFCRPAPSGEARAVTQNFQAPAHLSLYLLGWMEPDQQTLALENVATGEKLAIKPAQVPGGQWRLTTFVVPDSWRGQAVRIAAQTERSGELSFAGLSEPFDAGNLHDYKATLLLLLRLIEYYLLLSLLFFAVAARALKKNLHACAVLVLFGLAGAGVAAYTAFWIWFLAPKLGHFYSFLVPLAALAYLVRALYRMDRERRYALKALLAPWLLVFFCALFVTGAGFLFGGIDDPLDTAKTRFSHPLATDNELPYIFSEQIISGRILRPMNGDWLSSDRPPLETGFVLLQLPYVVAPRNLAYMLLAIILQSFWAPALWAFLGALQIKKKWIGWILAGVLFSGVVLVNSFFVWPKLLAAAYMIGFSALVLSPRLLDEMKRRKSLPLVAGTLLALSVLAHGGSLFALLGLVPTLLILRRGLPLRVLAFAAAALLVIYLPWTAYQKFFDPPGDRLLKWHLAGRNAPTSESFFHVLHDAYANATWEQLSGARKANAGMIIGSQPVYWRAVAAFFAQAPADLLRDRRDAARNAELLRTLQFFQFLFSLGLFMAGPVFLVGGLVRRFRTAEWRAAAVCWLYVLCTVLIWWMLLFLPNEAKVHQGTYTANLLAMAGSALAFWAVSRRFAMAVILVQSVYSFLLYVVYTKGTAPPGVLVEGVVHSGELILLIASLPLLVLNLRLVSRESERATIAPAVERVA